ncbi:MAG: branched-chain amino acid ABC transporter permease [Actinobacteria bacterium]|nr:branched-chain amino acid ABC transporter permease [Actinomycetota bacterium]
MQYIQYAVFGLVTGAILLLGTVGFSMVRRTENFLNIAHGQYVLLGAILGYTFYSTLHLNLFIAGALSIVATTFVGWVFNEIVFRPIRSYGGLYLLFSSVGVAYVIHGAIEVIYGQTPKAFLLAPPAQLVIAGYPLISSLQVLIIVAAAASAVALHLFLTRSRMGMAVRAMSSDYHLAQIRGINTNRVSTVVWLLSSALAALAGFLLGVYGTVYTDMGWAVILLILSAAVLGGVGSIYGVMVGSLLIGFGMEMSVIFLNPAYKAAVAFIIVMLVLVFKPEGILGGGKTR